MRVRADMAKQWGGTLAEAERSPGGLMAEEFCYVEGRH